MEDLDYFEIVVACLRYKNTKHHLEDYFIREFKKAKRADYEADEFFDGCMRAIETLLNLEKPELDDRKLYVKKPITLTEIKKDYLLTDTSRHHSSVIKRYGIEFDRDTALRPIRYKNYFQLIEPLKQAYIIRKSTSQKIAQVETKKGSQFSALEWSTIFYYAETTKLTHGGPNVETRMKQFIKVHKIGTTFKSFRNHYYEAKKRINNTYDYPISKLEKILGFINENYFQGVKKVVSDIKFLEENAPDY